MDPETKTEAMATVNSNGTYTVELAPGHTYNASLTSANGWGMTKETKQVAPAMTEITTGKTHNLVVEAKSQYTYSGTITGFAPDYDTSRLAITMIPDADSKTNDGAEDIDLTLTGMNFTALLDPSVVYTLEMTGVNDYQIKSPDEVSSDGDALTGQTIEVETKPLIAASGKFVVLDEDDQFAPLYDDSTYDALPAAVTKLQFKNVDDGYTYDAAVADGGYTASLRTGAYEAVATVSGYTTISHVVVADKAVTKDLLFVAPASTEAADYAADIYVDGVGSAGNHFKTVTGAMAYIKRMTRTDDQRVTVHITPGTYREQICIDSKNVTFVNDDPSKDVVLTWYYGIGYTYYSASTSTNANERWYDAQNAFDKYELDDINIARWGCTVRVQAPGFQARDIIFENSFNYYLTDEELTDGVTPSKVESIRFAREYGADVTSKEATERAAVLWVDTNSGRGDMTEFENCKFLSSQDTLVTGKRMYFKDCYIEGMTDYICGPGDVVFDTCTLNWKGYSDATTSGYVTAPQTAADETGYLFRSCYISGDTDLQLGAGGLGRTWGVENTGCIFFNTTLQREDLVKNDTWADMNGFEAKNATKIKEWGTMLPDGTKVDLSKRTLQNTVAATEPAIDVEGTYFKTWEPEYYAAEVTGVALKEAPTVKDNGDINLPRHGHTLTVVYTLTPEANNANDASIIQWYRVAADGAETLVKASNAADKTYYIQEDDAGFHIKVTVTPQTIGGQTGEPMSFTVAEAVQEGFDDPTGKTDPVLGTGVNVYLVGDSTVMDYSAAGMHNSGTLRPEGSWGEWLQQFFNDKVTIVNYAKGGRTTRQFKDEDHFLDEIDKTMKEGDFLFIQFGHNDCYSGATGTEARYVPLGIAAGDAQKSYAEGGVYPDTTTGGETTYTGYLKQYIAVTEKHGATAVLMTPVARMYYTSDGAIRPHHDAPVDGTNDNEYCKAVKWVYDWAVDQGYNVAFQDNYQLTADLFEKAYADCTETNRQTYGMQLMGVDEGTHNNKLGGLIEAAVVAQAIQNSDLSIAKAVKAPAGIQGKTPEGEIAFTVNGSGVLSAFDMLSTPAYAGHATYWEGEGQAMFTAIAAKAEELNGGQEEDPTTYDITVNASEHGTVSANPSGKAAANTKVTLTVTPEEGYELDTLSVATAETTKVNDTTYTFQMPAANVTVTATFKAEGGSGEGGTVTKDALNKAIEAAEAKMGTIYTVADTTKATDVTYGREFITNAGKAAVEEAIKGAKAIAGKEDAAQKDVDDALAALNKALADNIQTGTRRTGGGSSGGGSSSSSGGTISGTTTTNPNGSSTTTTTDRTTGTVTETTKNTDGSTSVKETKTDGTVTETTTSTDGSSKAVETKTDGTVTTTEKAVNGVEIKTVSQPGKSVAASVTIPSTVESAIVTIPDTELTPGTVAIDADTGEIIKLSVPTADGLAVKLDGSRNIILVDNSIHFNDVNDVGHWAEDYVAFVSSHELFIGTSESTFSPESNTSRAQLMTVLARLEGADTSGDALQKGMEWAVQAGISDGSNPDENISRQQVAVMLWRYAGSPESTQALAASDAGDIADYAQTALAWAMEKGILTGYPDGTLKPGDSATRAHVAAMVQRFCAILV